MGRRYIHLLFVLVFTMAACGRREQRVQTLSSTNGTKKSVNERELLAQLNDPTCKSKSACQKPSFQVVDSAGKTPEIQKASVGQDVSWTFKIQSEAIKGRLMIAPRELPLWASATDSGEIGTKIIAGKPDAIAVGAKLVLVVRDMMECKVSEDSLDTCLDSKKPLSYDKLISITYSIAASSAAAAQTTVPNTSTAKSSTSSPSPNPSVPCVETPSSLKSHQYLCR